MTWRPAWPVCAVPTAAAALPGGRRRARGRRCGGGRRAGARWGRPDRSAGGQGTGRDSARAEPEPNPNPNPNRGIVHGRERGGWGTPSYEVLSLPDAGASFPAWSAFDQDTGRFLFIAELGAFGLRTDPQPSTPAGYEAQAASVRTMRVLAPGLDAPVATIHCGRQCNLMHSFGPGQDEVTALVSPGIRGTRMAQV